MRERITATTMYAPKDIAKSAGVHEVTVYHHIEKGFISASRSSHFWQITEEEFLRAVHSYSTRGFVLPVECEGWHSVQELCKEIEKADSSIHRYLELGYIQGRFIKGLRGAGGRWFIEPKAYDSFLNRYREARQHLSEWSTMAEYCKLIGLSRQWVGELIRAGRIDADKITRVEAMLCTKDKHTYRIPPCEMERAREVSQLLSIGDLLSGIDIDGMKFSRNYFLYKVFPVLGLGQTNHPTVKARVRPEDVARILEYVSAQNQTLRFQRMRKARDAFNTQVRQQTLDNAVLEQPAPGLDDDSSLGLERTLWLFVKQGNEAAFGKLVETYKPYIVSKAYAFGRNVDVESKVAHGILGLWKAVLNAAYFGPSIRGYAKKYIKGYIKEFIKAERWGRAVSLELKVGKQTLGQILGVDD